MLFELRTIHIVVNEVFNMKIHSLTYFATVVFICGTNQVNASSWVLSEERSQVSFVTVKKNSVGEQHHFTEFSGLIKNDTAEISIQTASVETLIPIRNERMRDFLFKSDLFPTIDVTAQLGKGFLKNHQHIKDFSLSATVSMSGKTQPVEFDALIASVDNNTIYVSSIEPILVDAASFNLAEGVDKLSELVGGIGISKSVPVSFKLVFEKESERKDKY